LSTRENDQTWDLDGLYPGGSASPQFATFLSLLDADITAFTPAMVLLQQGFTPAGGAVAVWQMQDIMRRVREAGAFVSCLAAQDVNDGGAKLLESRISQLRANFNGGLTQINDLLLQLDDSAWEQLLAVDGITEVAFALNERRNRAKLQLDSGRESLIADLSVDGYEAWGHLYNTLVGRMTIPFEDNRGIRQLSMGQAANLMHQGEKPVREAVATKYEEAFATQSELFANTLNYLGGFRLAVYKHRKWDDVLADPLEINRMNRQTLDTMWAVIARNKAPFVDFLNRKAKVMKQDKLDWHDVGAPIAATQKQFSFDEARDFIASNFSKFSPHMGEFAQMCFDKRWIEAEDRGGKRVGGFCTSLPVSEQTRIFMTFSGSPSNVATLAHELGHAYHQHVMRGLPQLVSNYAMNVAETASTFAEMIVADAAVREAQTNEEKIVLLEDKAQRSISFFMNIHARFLFETRFYEARKSGVVRSECLNQLMVEAQREAFKDSLASYHPHFWASKLHFYITGTPFYNFPYTFGYMFSSGIYARALAEGPTFADKYVSLLRDTGRMRVEDLAQKHLGVDLTTPDFWQSAVDMAAADVQEFLALTE